MSSYTVWIEQEIERERLDAEEKEKEKEREKEILVEDKENLLLENESLKTRVTELEQIIQSLIWKSYHYRIDQIYPFCCKNGIRQTAKKFDMPIQDVIDFITECDESSGGIENAMDYKDCCSEVYGEGL